MKELIFNTPWNWMRWLRLIIGIALIVSLIKNADKLAGLFGLIFLYQALFNAGCGVGNCAVPKTNSKTNKHTEEIEFEEIKG